MFPDGFRLGLPKSLANPCAWLAAVGLWAGAPLQAQVQIDFELAGPCSFFSSFPLRDQYASLGIHFRGGLPLDGGAVLDTCGNFGIAPRSGVDFYAFNPSAMMGNGGIPRGPGEMIFDQRIRE